LIDKQFVKTGVNWKTETHYERLGYEVNNGVLQVRYSHLPPSSTIVLSGVCDSCGIRFKEQYHRIFRNRVGYSIGIKDYCRMCLSFNHQRGVIEFDENKVIKAKNKVKSTNEQYKSSLRKFKKGFYLYRFKDAENKIIYIGLTTQKLVYRINQHFNCGHLSRNCYESVDRVEYAEVKSESEMRIYEIYLINRYTPEYNTEFKRGDAFTFELPKLNWHSYLSEIGNRSILESEAI
jgi:hypothetical protein